MKSCRALVVSARSQKRKKPLNPGAQGFPMSRDITTVREGGLEPPRPFGHWNLNPARLPIPPLARVAAQT